MYEAKDYGEYITPVNVVKETACRVTISYERYGKVYEQIRNKEGTFFESWDAAKAHLVSLAQARVDNAKHSLKYAEDRLGNMKGLKAP